MKSLVVITQGKTRYDRLAIIEMLRSRFAVLYQILKSKSKNENGDAIDIEDLEECLGALGFSPDDEDLDFLKKHLDDNSTCFIYNKKNQYNNTINTFIKRQNPQETPALQNKIIWQIRIRFNFEVVNRWIAGALRWVSQSERVSLELTTKRRYTISWHHIDGE